ncbi:MAG: hypothetical protein WKF45_04960 [Ilumatobacteraceae bacterium]
MLFAQQEGGRGRDIAEALTSVPGSVWLLIGLVAIIVAIKFFASTMKRAVIVGAIVGTFILMNGPGLTGTGMTERWNDVKAKAEAFWNGDDVRFNRQG